MVFLLIVSTIILLLIYVIYIIYKDYKTFSEITKECYNFLLTINILDEIDINQIAYYRYYKNKFIIMDKITFYIPQHDFKKLLLMDVLSYPESSSFFLIQLNIHMRKK